MMKEILLLTKSYFHKTKGQAMTLVLLIGIVVMLLNIGMIMHLGLATFFDERAEELNAPHFGVVVGHGLADASEVETFLANHESVIDIERRDVLFKWGDIFIGGEPFSQGLILETEDPLNTMNPPSLIGDYLPLTGDAIYVPHFLMIDDGLTIGDPLRLRFGGEEIHFTVAGSTEEILMGSMMNGGIRFYISEEKAAELADRFSANMYTLITTRLSDPEESSRMFNDINNAEFTINEANEGSMHFLPVTHEFARTTRTMMATIIGITVIALAGILLVVSAVVVRFRVNHHIEMTIKDIGILKGIGYSNGQISRSIVLQFSGLSLVGGVVGLGLVFIGLPFLAQMMAGQIGLIWEPSLEWLQGSLSIAVVLLFILLITTISVRCIKKLYPLTALRDGIATHNFRKNHAPLENSKLPLVLALSLKKLLQNKKQLVALTVIVAGLAFSAVSSVTVYYSMMVNNEAFGNVIGGTMSDVSISIRDGEEMANLRHWLEEMPEVEGLFARSHGGNRANVNEANVSLIIVEHTDYLGNHMLVEGRFPRHDNEIAISPVLANMAGFEVGQPITMNRDGVEVDYLVTGVVQMMRDMGFFVLLTGDAMHRFDADVTMYLLDMDLAAGVDLDAFVNRVEDEFGEFIRVFRPREEFTSMFVGIGATVTPVVIGNVIISGVVVVLVLYMLLKTMIHRRQKEFGIQKALGYTNMQLMNQLAMNLLPTIVLGTLLGATAGYFGFNLIFIAIMRGFGIGTANLPTPLLWVVMLVVGMLLLSYIVALFISRKIRKISAYELVSNGLN